MNQLAWLKQLDKKRFRIQLKGAKSAYVVTRPIEREKGKWDEVELNARVR